MPHRLDPPAQTEAARRLGKLMAQGIVSYDDVLPQLVDAAVKLGGYSGCLSGLQSRLAGTLRECADHWRIERSKAEWVVRRELTPMLDALAEGLVILRAAHATNERLGEPLLRSEVMAIVEAEMAARMALMAPAPQPKGRRRHVR